MSGSPTFDTGKKQKRGEFKTLPYPTDRRSKKRKTQKNRARRIYNSATSYGQAEQLRKENEFKLKSSPRSSRVRLGVHQIVLNFDSLHNIPYILTQLKCHVRNDSFLSLLKTFQ